jgi:hypothetical protein
VKSSIEQAHQEIQQAFVLEGVSSRAGCSRLTDLQRAVRSRDRDLVADSAITLRNSLRASDHPPRVIAPSPPEGIQYSV